MTKTTTPLHSDTAAVWGAFLFEGLMVSESHPARATEILNRWGDSCTDLVSQACGVLPTIWNAVQPYWESQVFDRPGAFETEVISDIGRTLAKEIGVNVDSLQNAGEDKQELDIILGRVPWFKEIDAGVRRQRPVIVLA